MDLSDTPRLPTRLARLDRSRKSNLKIALLLVPVDRRGDVFLFHDFCRLVDDIADSPELENSRKQNILDLWLQALQPDSHANLPEDLRSMLERRSLDTNLMSEIVRGVRMDTERNRYPGFSDLRAYCWRVASAVGLVTSSLFGTRGTEVEKYAEELGIALQLTNILRDVGEDALMDRIYIPLEDLKRFGVTEREILHKCPSPATTHLFSFQAERADAYFAKAELAWSQMSLNQRRHMRPARLMGDIYRGLLSDMHRDRYDVLQRTYRVSAFDKLRCLAKVFLHP